MLANVNSTKIHVVLVQHELECALCEDANTRRRNVSAWGWIIHRELYSVTPAHSGIIICDPQAITPRNALNAQNLNFVAASVLQTRSSKWWPWRLTFEPKISRLGQGVEDYYCAKFQVTPIRGFRLIVLTYPQTNKRNPHHDKAIAIHAPPYVNAYNNIVQT